MSGLGTFNIDDVVTFSVNTHTPTSGAATDADAVPAYRVYEDETGTAILTGNMAKLDDANTTGYYSEQLTLSAANGFENGKSYNIYVSAAVGGTTGTKAFQFQVALQKVDVTAISGDSTAADNLEAACDGTGYNLGNGSVVAASVTGSVGGNVVGSVASVTAGVTVTTNNDKSSYSLTADQSGVTIGTVNALGTSAVNSVNAEMDTALADIGLDHLISSSLPTNWSTDVAAGSVFADIAGSTFDTSTDSNEALRNRGDSAWTTGAGGTPPQLLQNTTIATLSTQTSFTLTAGSADDDAYNGAVAIITDSATSTQKAVASISDYVGSTKTVTLSSDPSIFTMAAGDTIDILAAISNAPTAAAIRAEIDSNSTQLAAIVADTNEIQGDLADGGRLDLIFDAILVDTGTSIPSTLSAIGSSVDSNSTAISLVSDSVNDMQGATFNTATDSLEAIRNQGDAAWITATGFATSAALATVDSNVDAILVDTGTTIPALFPSNFADLAITSSTGYVTVGGFLGAALTESTSGRIAGNFDTFFENADAATSQTVDDVGGGGGGGGDATEANQTTIITHLTDIKGGTFSDSTDSLEAIRDRGDAAWTTGAGGSPPQLLQSTTIATLASQTNFTLTAGSSDNDAYAGATVVITDAVTSTQKAVGVVASYTGDTKTITLTADPGVFTMAAGDSIAIIAGTFVASAGGTVGWLG